MTPQTRLRTFAAHSADRLPLLIDAYRLAVNPRWEVANWRDYRATYRDLAWLREIPTPDAGAPRALFVLRREDIFDIKINLMLGAALKLEGVRPVVLTQHPRVPRIRRYAAAFGVETLHYRSAFPLDAEARREVEAWRQDAMARPDAFAAVKEWTYRGHPLGQRVLSTLIRQTLDGDPDLSDPDVRRRMNTILGEVLTNYHQAEAIYDAVDPTWVMAAETGYATNGPLVDVAMARGLDVLEASPFLRDGALIFKRANRTLGQAATVSVSQASLQTLERRPWSDTEDAELEAELAHRYAGGSALQKMYQWNTESLGRDEICRHLGLDPSLPLAVVFSHVLWDASFFFGRDLFAHYGEWLAETVQRAVANPRINWLIKTHPSNAFRLAHGDVEGPVAEVELVRDVVDELPDHVRLVLPETQVSSLSLYHHADLGVTVRGTPGLEMACFGKPVVTGGTGHYSGLGFTLDSATAEDYLEKLDRADSLLAAPDESATLRARRYAHALLRHRPWHCHSFDLRLDYPEDGWHPLDRNVVARARSLAEANDFGDLAAWAAWAVRSKDADFLQRETP